MHRRVIMLILAGSASGSKRPSPLVCPIACVRKLAATRTPDPPHKESLPVVFFAYFLCSFPTRPTIDSSKL